MLKFWDDLSAKIFLRHPLNLLLGVIFTQLMRKPAVLLIFVGSEIHFLVKFQQLDFSLFKIKLGGSREGKGDVKNKVKTNSIILCSGCLLSVANSTCKFLTWRQFSFACQFPLYFMLHLPGCTWQGCIGLWDNELYSFPSFQHLIFFSPNWPLILVEYLVGLHVLGWKGSGMQACLVHLHFIQRSVWLLKLVMSSVTQSWLRILRKQLDERRVVGSFHCWSKANVRVFFFPLYYGMDFPMWGRNRVALPEDFFLVGLWLKITTTKKMTIWAVL